MKSETTILLEGWRCGCSDRDYILERITAFTRTEISARRRVCESCGEPILLIQPCEVTP